MATVTIHDLRNDNVLALDLRHLLDLLAPRSLRANWIVSTVVAWRGIEHFEATGPGGEQLDEMAQMNAKLAGPILAALAKDTRQVIWGQFVGSLPETEDRPWVTIQAIDSTYYKVTTLDEMVLEKIRSSFKDVRSDDVPGA